MCCRRVAAALLPQLNLLLAVLSSASIAVAVMYGAPLADAAAAALLAAVVASLLLAHLALAAAPASRKSRRTMLLVYALCMLLVVCVEAAIAAWSLWRAAEWLRQEGALARLMRGGDSGGGGDGGGAMVHWLRPALPVLAPQLVGELPEEETHSRVWCAWVTAVAVPVLQLLAAATALVARPGREGRVSDLSRSSSVVFASHCVLGSPVKAPLHEPAVWQ